MGFLLELCSNQGRNFNHGVLGIVIANTQHVRNMLYTSAPSILWNGRDIEVLHFIGTLKLYLSKVLNEHQDDWNQ